MRFLYGIQTTGHGHLVRSTPIVQGLRDRGHEVSVLLSGPAPAPVWLERLGAGLDARTGLSFVAEGGRIRRVATIRRARPIRFLNDTLRLDTRPYDVVVTDYEPITAWAARRQGVRSIGIGHLYAFAWRSVPRQAGDPLAHLVMDAFAPATVPVGSHWHPFGAPLLPPFVAPDARTLVRDAIEPRLRVVYLGFEDLDRVVALLRQFPAEQFHVYARVPAPVTHGGHVAVRPLSRVDFLKDLARCQGVIANAGFTLASECLHLGLPLLVKPVAGQLEQTSNAVALERLGLARVTTRLERDDVAAWLRQPAPAAQGYPDVTVAVTAWLAAGAQEPLDHLSRRLWQACGGAEGRQSAAA